MATGLRARWTGFLAVIVVCAAASSARSQNAAGIGQGGDQGTEDRVVIEREAMRLIDPKRYQVPLDLRPVQHVTIAAPVSGRVKSVLQKTGDKLASGTSVVLLDDTEQSLLLDQAKANLKVAEIELRRAKKQADADLVELAEARLAVAEAAEKLAKLRLDQMAIRVPFDGEVFRVTATEGQIVTAGAPLLEFANPMQLRVELPVDRNSVKADQTIPLTVEDKTVNGKVESVLPLDARFAPLRELVESLASAIVVVDNKSAGLRPGQLVDIPIVPQQFVAQIPNRALSNGSNGTRKVQVVRSGVVRNVDVNLLGKLGTDLSYVSGRFGAGDELIVGTSKSLTDGTQVRPAEVAAAAEETRNNTRNGAAGAGRTGSGF